MPDYPSVPSHSYMWKAQIMVSTHPSVSLSCTTSQANNKTRYGTVPLQTISTSHFLISHHQQQQNSMSTQQKLSTDVTTVHTLIYDVFSLYTSAEICFRLYNLRSSVARTVKRGTLTL